MLTRTSREGVFFRQSRTARRFFLSMDVHNVFYTLSCPCLAFAQVDAWIAREDCVCVDLTAVTWSARPRPLPTGTRTSTAFSGAGIKSCLGTSILCLFGWPLSPLLGLYLHARRAKWHDIYTSLHHDRSDYSHTRPNETIISAHSAPSFKEFAASIVLWPCLLSASYVFLQKHHIDETIHFHWEEGESFIRDARRPKPQSQTQKVLMFGGSTAQRVTIIRKLLGCCHSGMNSVRKDEMHNDSSFFGDREDYFEQSKTELGYMRPAHPRIGVRTVSISDEHIGFLELWNMPTSVTSDVTLRTALFGAVVICLLVNAEDPSSESFEYMTYVYEQICYMLDDRGDDRPLFICLSVGSSSDSDQVSLSLASDWCSQTNIKMIHVTENHNDSILVLKRQLINQSREAFA
jgi:hypothetical protein